MVCQRAQGKHRVRFPARRINRRHALAARSRPGREGILGTVSKSMTATRKNRWGVLGWAKIARECVIPAIQRSCNSEFEAIGSRDAAKLAECRRMFDTAKTYSSYDEVLRDPEVDAVYIPLPNSLHREWTIKAAV